MSEAAAGPVDGAVRGGGRVVRRPPRHPGPLVRWVRPGEGVDLEVLALLLAPFAIGAAALLRPETIGLFTGPCRFRLLAGFGCPTCGITRALTSLGHGHVLEAFTFQPLGTALAVAGLLYLPWAAMAVGRGWRRPRIDPRSQTFASLRWVGLGAVLANWAYLVAQGI